MDVLFLLVEFSHTLGTKETLSPLAYGLLKAEVLQVISEMADDVGGRRNTCVYRWRRSG